MRAAAGGKNKNRIFDLESVEWKKKLFIESYGVRIGIRSDVEEIVEEISAKLSEILPGGWQQSEETEIEHWFSIYKGESKGTKSKFYKNAELYAVGKFDAGKLDFFVSQVRLTVAEFAPRHVFLHSGVVGYKNRAVIIPGRSFSGKTTLVGELIKRGCRYYSDEYAVINERGMVEPYAKKLSVRGIVDEYTQVDIAAEKFGGTTGTKPIPVGLVLVTEYKRNAKFKPRRLSAGAGIIALIANSVSIRRNPQFVLQILKPLTEKARVIGTKRGEAKNFADRFLEILDEDAC